MAQHLDLLLEVLVPAAYLPEYVILGMGDARLFASLDLAWLSHLSRMPAWIPKSFAICEILTPSSRFLETCTTSSRSSCGYLVAIVIILPSQPKLAMSNVTNWCSSPKLCSLGLN
jgi:hypothetical protein